MGSVEANLNRAIPVASRYAFSELAAFPVESFLVPAVRNYVGETCMQLCMGQSLFPMTEPM